MASIISFTFREAVEDVEYQGYHIPKGWKVMPLFRNIHHNPQFYADPLRFDPTRFEVITSLITKCDLLHTLMHVSIHVRLTPTTN